MRGKYILPKGKEVLKSFLLGGVGRFERRHTSRDTTPTEFPLPKKTDYSVQSDGISWGRAIKWKVVEGANFLGKSFRRTYK